MTNADLRHAQRTASYSVTSQVDNYLNQRDVTYREYLEEHLDVQIFAESAPLLVYPDSNRASSGKTALMLALQQFFCAFSPQCSSTEDIPVTSARKLRASPAQPQYETQAVRDPGSPQGSNGLTVGLSSRRGSTTSAFPQMQILRSPRDQQLCILLDKMLGRGEQYPTRTTFEKDIK
eukprot:Clim_evm18s23 gene=Clim_evmTU18s23